MDQSDEVRQLGADLQQLLGKMEALKQEFLTAVAEWLRPWFKATFTEVVGDEPETAERLGEEGLRTLNDEVERLQEQTHAVVEQEAGAKHFWWHYEKKHAIPEENRRMFFNPGHQDMPTIPWRQAVAIRYAAGRLWPVLNRAGFLDRRGDYAWDGKGRWENWPHGQQPAANASVKPYYPHSLRGLPARLEGIMQRYEALIPKVEEKERMIAAKTRAIARENALSLLERATKKK